MPSRWTGYRLGACLIEDAPMPAPALEVSPSGLPERVDLRAHCSPVEDQGRIGSCAANAVVGAMEYHQRRAGEPPTELSRLFVYYNARALADRQSEDAGTYIHHVMAAVLAHGACPERLWPYQQAMWAMKPHDSCYQAASYHEAVEYARTPLGPVCKAVIAAGLPVVFGASLPNAWMQEAGSPSAGVMRPAGDWPAPGGGHAMLIVGYDDAARAWIIRNSWGADWGDRGHAYVDYDVLARYSHPHSYWTIGAIEAQPSFSLTGRTVAETQSEIVEHAAASMSAALSEAKMRLREQLEDEHAKMKSGIRSRLRGPGAGGGY